MAFCHVLLLIKGNVHFEIRDPYPSEAMVFWQKLEYIKIYVIDPINRNLISQFHHDYRIFDGKNVFSIELSIQLSQNNQIAKNE